MRLLIYLLAMMTGFSAAEVARPVSATPATLGSAVAQAAVIASSVASVEHQAASVSMAEIPLLSAFTAAPVAADISVTIASPVTRHDLTRQ
jgi:hypothetical protein